MSPEAESPPYVLHCVPNRSLGAQGRRWFLAALISTTFAVATAAMLIGAWPVMPRIAGAIALAAAAAARADCHVDILPPVTPVSNDIYHLHWGILWVCVVIFFIVFGAMFWSIFKHRRSLGAKAAQFHENTTIEVIWTIVPFIILIGMAYPATRTVLEMKDASNADMSRKVTAYQWKWEYDYQQDAIRFFP